MPGANKPMDLKRYSTAISASGIPLNKITGGQLAKIVGGSRHSAYRAISKLKSSTGVTVKQAKETSKVEGNTWEVSIDETRICTLDQLLDHCKVDRTQWTVKSFICNKWEGYTADGEGAIKVSPLFQVKATLERAKDLTLDAIKAEVESLKKTFNKSVKPTKAAKSSTGNSLELSLYDAHYGRLSWGEETGWADYDLPLAAKVYNDAVDSILERCKFPLDEICYVVGNDLVHFDNLNATTTRGTSVDVDSRFSKVFRKVRETVQLQIEKLRKIAPVKVYMVPGNHDTLSIWHLGDSLECYYNGADDVEVFNSPNPRKYYTYGKNMIMFCHGDKGKHEDYPLIMANEKPTLWAESDFREVHLGHFHHMLVKDKVGCRIRVIPALCPPDYWHSSNGYVGSVRGAQGFVWSKENGLVATIEHSIKENLNG